MYGIVMGLGVSAYANQFINHAYNYVYYFCERGRAPYKILVEKNDSYFHGDDIIHMCTELHRHAHYS